MPKQSSVEQNVAFSLSYSLLQPNDSQAIFWVGTSPMVKRQHMEVAHSNAVWLSYISGVDPGFLERGGGILGLQAKKKGGGGVQEVVQFWAQCKKAYILGQKGGGGPDTLTPRL